MSKPIIAPSILAADFRNLEKEVNKINSSAAEWIHFDVMDGVNVPNISFGFPVLQAVRSLTEKYIDAHLMIDSPERYFQEFFDFGANGVTIPYKDNGTMMHSIKKAKEIGLKIGIALDPDIEIDVLDDFISDLDLVLIMSVFPGFGGQKFIETTFDKVKQLKSRISDLNLSAIIEVDGGVSIENSARLVASGADALVSGSALFKSDDFNQYVDQLKS